MEVPSERVSVVIPTFNRARYLPESIRSVVAQSHRNLELLVVDDGSTDETSDVFATFDDSRIRVIRIPHSGSPARARNVGIAQAGGAYLAFLDSDDVWLPDKLESQLAALSVLRRCRWSYTLFDHIDETGAPMAPLRGGVGAPHSGWIVEHIVSGSALVMVPSVLAQADLVREVGGFDERPNLREDLDLCLRLAVRSEACALDRSLLRIRHHGGRTTFALPEVREWKVRALEKLAGSTSDVRVRRLCRRECAYELIELAGVYDATRRPASALRILSRAFSYRPWAGAWWTTLAKAIVRPVIPRRLLEAYRRLRHRDALNGRFSTGAKA